MQCENVSSIQCKACLIRDMQCKEIASNYTSWKCVKKCMIHSVQGEKVCGILCSVVSCVVWCVAWWFVLR